MELGRGKVDAMVLAFIKKTEFRKGDFAQTITGEVHLQPGLARAVVALCSIPSDFLLEYARVLRDMIMGDKEIDS
jgi:hypothetical protein